MDGNLRINIKPGMLVNIILKKDQRSGMLTEGIVKDILTSRRDITAALKCVWRMGRSGVYRRLWKLKFLFYHFPY